VTQRLRTTALDIYLYNILGQRGPTTFKPFYKNVAAHGLLPIKWYIKQQIHNI